MPLNAAGQMQIATIPELEIIPEPECSVRRLSPIKDERVVDICECVMDIVAAFFYVSGRELRQQSRSSTSVTRVRQIGMYVTHVVLQLNMSEVGRGFGRDRKTVQYACHLIEDLRDDPEFDCVIHLVERVTAAAFGQAGVTP